MSLKAMLQGPKLDINDNYGGLGSHYLTTLSDNLNKINQIDTVTGVTETNGSVRTRAMQIGHELRHLGIAENDIILICSRCHCDQTITVLASLLIGAIAAPLPTEVNHKECVEIVKKLKPKICFCDIRALKQIDRVMAEIGLKTLMVLYGEHRSVTLSFQKLLMNKPGVVGSDFKPVVIDNPRKHISFIIPTQGSGGSPKLVCVSHHFIYSQTLILFNAIKKPEKIISFFPLCWILQVILMCLSFELPMVRVLGGTFAERTACKLIHDLKVDYAFLSTDLASKLAEHVAVRDFNLSCLRYIFIGASYRKVDDIKQLIVRLPRVKFIQIYCTTETGIVATCPVTDYELSTDRIGTVGKVVYNTRVKIVDVDRRNELGTEKNGELLVKNDAFMSGYFKNMPMTKAASENGYFKTGDLARCDGSGWLYITEKIVDLLVTENNEKLSPIELETVIMRHPYVKDVAVIGDEREIVACIVLKPDTRLDEDKLLTFISQRLPAEKWPNRIMYFDTFPTTAVGKVKKNILRNNYLKVQIEHSDSFYNVVEAEMIAEMESVVTAPSTGPSRVPSRPPSRSPSLAPISKRNLSKANI